jgi:hypothetical protein
MSDLAALMTFLGDPLLTIPDVSSIMKVHANTVHNWIADGLVTERQNGNGHQRVKVSELYKYLGMGKNTFEPPPSVAKPARKCSKSGCQCEQCQMCCCEGC